MFRQCLIYKHIYIYIFYISTYSVFTTTLGDIYFRDEQPEVQRSQVPCRGMWKIWNSNTGSVDHVSLLRMLSSVSRQDPLSCPSPGFARLFFAWLTWCLSHFSKMATYDPDGKIYTFPYFQVKSSRRESSQATLISVAKKMWYCDWLGFSHVTNLFQQWSIQLTPLQNGINFRNNNLWSRF